MHEGIAWRASFSRYPDGTLGEVFLDHAKVGSSAGSAADEAAISASLALQFGCTEADLGHALPKLADGSPAGPLGTALRLYRGGRSARR